MINFLTIVFAGGILFCFRTTCKFLVKLRSHWGCSLWNPFYRGVPSRLCSPVLSTKQTTWFFFPHGFDTYSEEVSQYWAEAGLHLWMLLAQPPPYNAGTSVVLHHIQIWMVFKGVQNHGLLVPVLTPCIVLFNSITWTDLGQTYKSNCLLTGANFNNIYTHYKIRCTTIYIYSIVYMNIYASNHQNKNSKSKPNWLLPHFSTIVSLLFSVRPALHLRKQL